MQFVLDWTSFSGNDLLDAMGPALTDSIFDITVLKDARRPYPEDRDLPERLCESRSALTLRPLPRASCMAAADFRRDPASVDALTLVPRHLLRRVLTRVHTVLQRLISACHCSDPEAVRGAAVLPLARHSAAQRDLPSSGCRYDLT
jgi:hypothetical protein